MDRAERFDGSYFPFGFGTRKCIGFAFAERQMQIILRKVLSMVDLEAAPGYSADPYRQMLLIIPSGGTMMQVRNKTWIT